MSTADAKQLQLLIDKVNSLNHKVDHLVSRRMCFNCNGTGIVKIGEKDCPVCGSSGWTSESNQQVLDRRTGRAGPLVAPPQQMFVQSDQKPSSSSGGGGHDESLLGTGIAL